MKREDMADSLESWRENLTHADTLMRLHDKRRDGPEKDALWSGYYWTKQNAADWAHIIIARGGLLFLHAPGA